jgi:hypothetical protein
MRSAIAQFVKNFLFPGPSKLNHLRYETAVEGLVLAHGLILQLATQIEAHAAGAPYPHMRRILQTIASQKYEGARKLRTLIEKLGERPRLATGESKTGINHWERLNLDLQDQIAVDDLLFTLELRAGETPDVAKVIEELRSTQKSHRRILSDLIAIADPQATQT